MPRQQRIRFVNFFVELESIHINFFDFPGYDIVQPDLVFPTLVGNQRRQRAVRAYLKLRIVAADIIPFQNALAFQPVPDVGNFSVGCHCLILLLVIL